ncbi:CbiX/SirB N-terminal domain-containing protein [Actimicrobium sp. CCI2.3]|uniref:sirohydrochlorin chelatase n=1 Tax=Actimicrobium sp. CCI2.3 TaxID=3048616 RepID=UPI002AB549CC|nr:CbiX/SirB N-terminal domain-containing protein [Actimicrobium sp. CCI2.3]MDY7574122.1 CbiX/SirB N-terminal domain-containing protein [Actimicrobium sp. CCI2.3]MEB0023252.1 CbiX/SirB N-terminal domain-containing protein [Actimicrobium sp. CCI2.3]
MTRKALILFAHGARAAGWAAPFERLQHITSAQLPEVEVRLAFLELMTPQLPDTVAALAADGCSDITIVPVFLGQGSHLLRDLPLIVEELRSTHPQLLIRVAAAAGEDPDVLGAIARYCIVSMD